MCKGQLSNDRKKVGKERHLFNAVRGVIFSLGEKHWNMEKGKSCGQKSDRIKAKGYAKLLVKQKRRVKFAAVARGCLQVVAVRCQGFIASSSLRMDGRLHWVIWWNLYDGRVSGLASTGDGVSSTGAKRRVTAATVDGVAISNRASVNRA